MAARLPTNNDLQPILDGVGGGKSLRAICLEMGIHPGHASAWLHDDEGRAAQYARAREQRAEGLAEEALSISRAAALGMKVNDKKVDAHGARVLLDAIKWASARMAPKTAPVQRHEHMFSNMTDQELEAEIARLQAEAADGSDGASLPSA